MVVGGHLSDRSRQLRHLDLPLVVPLEAREHDLPLPGLEPVHHRGDRPLVVQVGEEDELLVDKVGVGHSPGKKEKFMSEHILIDKYFEKLPTSCPSRIGRSPAAPAPSSSCTPPSTP